MKTKILQLLLILFSYSATAQLGNGSQAPDFSLEDIGGVTHNLYDYLDLGYSVVLDFSATWCPPCWNYHQSGVLEDLWDDLGPGGDNNTIVFMIEADPNTSQPCIYGPSGCTGNSLGDWTSGVDYPILNPPAGGALNVRNAYAIPGWPTLYAVSPNGDLRLMGQAGYSTWESWVAESFQMWNTTWTVDDAGCDIASVDLDPVGGFGNINYQWSHGATTEDVQNLPEGDYYVTLTDNHGYEAVIGPIEVESNNYYEVNLLESQDVLCYGEQTGYISVEAEGGSGNFEYLWSNGDDTQEIFDLPVGIYNVTVTDAGTVCTAEATFFIEENDPLEISYDLVDAECGSDGMIIFDIDGGEDPYLYQFEDFSSYDDEVLLNPGEYNVTIYDVHGCSEVIESFEINQINGPTADTEIVGSFNCSSNPVFINADSSSVGSTIEYFWFDPSYVLIDTGFQVQVDSAGLYTLEVHDSFLACITSESVMVVEDLTTPVASASTLSSIDCDNSTAIVSSYGSTADSTVTYAWTTTDGVILTDPTRAEITVGSKGTYSLQVKNTNTSCSASSSTVVTAADVPVISLSGSDAFCAGASTTLCISQGTNESVEWFINGSPVSGGACLDINQSANVTVLLSDNTTGCEVTESISVNALETPTANISGDLEICANDGSATLCITENPNESVTWMINGSAVSNSSCIDYNLSSDVSVNIVNNVTGCSDSQSVSTLVNGIPSLSIDPAELLDCNNQSSTLNLNVGGGSGHTVQWVDSNGSPLSTNEDISVSSAGVYTAIVTTTAGCITQTSVEVQADLNELATAAFATDGTDYEFNFSDETDGNVNTYAWDFGDGTTSNAQNPNHTYAQAGYYTVCLTVTNDCGSTTDCEEVLAYTALQISSIVVDVTCNGDNDGAIRVSTIGGLAGFEYEWSGPVQGLNGSDLEDLSPGNYTVVVTDATGNVTSQDFTIVEPDELTIDGVVTNSPAGSNEGSISLNIEGGSGNYTVIWSNGDTGMMISGLERGDYEAVITDDNGCIETVSYSVSGTTNTNEIDFITEFTVVPNPASEFIDVKINSQLDKSLQLSLVNMAGQEFFSERTQGQNVNTRINLNEMAAGVYLVKVNSGNQVSIRKLIVVK